MFFHLTKMFFLHKFKLMLKIFLITVLIFLTFFSCTEKQEVNLTADLKKEHLYVKEPQGIYMYKAPNFDAETIQFLPKGTKLLLVEITDEFSTKGDLEGTWAKVFYNKFEGYVFLPQTQSYPELIFSQRDRIYTCITYLNYSLESTQIDHFILRENGIVEHLWVDEEVLKQGLDIRYMQGKYEENTEQVKIYTKKVYQFFKYENGYVLLTKENLEKIKKEPEIKKRLEEEIKLSDKLKNKQKESFWFCQKTDKLVLE